MEPARLSQRFLLLGYLGPAVGELWQASFFAVGEVSVVVIDEAFSTGLKTVNPQAQTREDRKLCLQPISNGSFILTSRD